MNPPLGKKFRFWLNLVFTILVTFAAIGFYNAYYFLRIIKSPAQFWMMSFILSSSIASLLILFLSKSKLLGGLTAQSENQKKLQWQFKRATSLLKDSIDTIDTVLAKIEGLSRSSETAVNRATLAVEEVKQVTQATTQKASEVSERTSSLSEISKHGNHLLEQTIAGMNQIRAQIGVISQSTSKLNEQSQQISEIISTVNDLAEQSNVLAINAAIQAAKAGDLGGGFAVLAQEIRTLSQQSKQGTVQIRNLISEMQKAAQTTIAAINEGDGAVVNRLRQTVAVGESISVLSASMNEAAQSANLISATSKQQLVSVLSLKTAIQEIEQSNSARTSENKQTEAAARELREQIQLLRELVSQVKVPESDRG